VNEPRIDAIRQTLAHVPPANYTLLAYICKVVVRKVHPYF